MSANQTCQIGDAHIFIDGTEIKGVLINNIPIPNVYTETATIEYYIIKEDPGQILLDKAIYENRKPHSYKVTLANEQTWEYEGVVYDYKLNTDEVAGMTIHIQLCGDFKYSRNGPDGKLEIERRF